ncbi:hypothetical protein BDZ45DRAFT_797223 [Acephala macrosclerotiorum]|nr:hypothetical protein BDZ45DRAFT_797223 [Acephala macrosclerotiorum]
MAEIEVRPALTTDLHQIVLLNIVANAQHPIIALPWKSYADLYGFSVATIASSSSSIDDPWGENFVQEEVVGFLIGTTPKLSKNGKGGEKGEDGEEEWKPVLPEGTNQKLFGYFLGVVIEDKHKYKTDDHWELETLSVSVNHQRKGIGAKLLDQWLKEVDADGRPVYIRASREGRGLYEKLGAKEVGISDTELGDFGVSVPYRIWNMVREGKR